MDDRKVVPAKMNEREKLPQGDMPSYAPPDVAVDGHDAGDDHRGGRRRLLKVGASATPVLMTILSRPAFGVGVCTTPSGFSSANLSQHGTPQSCSGVRPEYWSSHTNPGDWPPPYFPTAVPGSGGHAATTFHGVFAGSVFGAQTLLEVMQSINGGATDVLGKNIAAALLNAAMGWTPVLSVGQVLNIWSEFVTNGYFQPTTGVNWYATDISQYLVTTMPL